MSSHATVVNANALLVSQPRLQPRWDSRVHSLLRPALRAWLLGYGFSVGPRIFSLLVHHLLKALRRQKPRGQDDDAGDAAAAKKAQTSLFEALAKTLKAGTELNRFPAFCGSLVGGSTLLEVCGSVHKHSVMVK